VWCYNAFGLSVIGAKWLFFGCFLIVLAVTDLRTRLLPDAVTWTGFGIGLAFSVAAPPQGGVASPLIWRVLHRVPASAVIGLVDALVGAAFGSLMLYLAGWLYRKWRGREGMGMGDVKMMAMVGVFLGLRDTFLTILTGTVLGTVIGVGIVLLLYASGWKGDVAQRASRRGLGSVNAMRYALASRYQLPLGTFLGVAALAVVVFANYALHWWLAWTVAG
jgi:leader peptidase (prepilin peptidase)/N-methyltransferase